MTSKDLRRLIQKGMVEKVQPIGKLPSLHGGFVIPNLSGDHAPGRQRTTPTTDLEIANKKYVDDNSGGSGDMTKAVYDPTSVEDDAFDMANMVETADAKVMTGTERTKLAGIETGADNSTDVTLAGTPDYITIAGQVITRGTIDISDDTNLIAGTNCTLSGDTLNVDDAFLVNNADDTTTGTITMAGGIITGDASNADTAYVPMVLYNTDATPPAASGFPIGTIYVQYTA